MTDKNSMGKCLVEKDGKLFDLDTGRPLVTGFSESDRYKYGEEYVLRSHPEGFRYTEIYRFFIERFREMVVWDFNILTKGGEKLETIAEEVYGKKELWKEIFENNNADEFVRKYPGHVYCDDPTKLHKIYPLNDNSDINNLPNEIRLKVYLGFRAAELYGRAHPERCLRDRR